MTFPQALAAAGLGGAITLEPATAPR